MGSGLLPQQMMFTEAHPSTESCANITSATPKPKPMPVHQREEDTKTKKGDYTHHHSGALKGKRTDIPFTKAEAIWRAVVAWRWGAVHLVGHVRPRGALWKEHRTVVTRGPWWSGATQATELQTQLLSLPCQHRSRPAREAPDPSTLSPHPPRAQVSQRSMGTRAMPKKLSAAEKT